MKNRVKYIVCLFSIILMAVLITTSKNEGRKILHQSNIMTFEAGDFSINSSAELTTLNYGNVSGISTSSRRITRTTKTPSHPQFGDAVLMCSSNNTPKHPNTNTNNNLISNNFSGKDYLFILCCIRI